MDKEGVAIVGMNYVMADIHGQYGMLMDMLEKLELNSKDRLYILGDLTDRGPEPVAVIRYLMGESKARLIRGNHDQMLIDYFAGKPGAKERWTRPNNGGQATLDALMTIPAQERHDIIDWLASLPLYLLHDEYILVHAGLRMRPHASLPDLLSQQELDDYIWIREDFYKQPAVEGHTVIFGHTRTPRLWGCNDTNTIWHDPIHKDKIGIDCGAYASKSGGRLACLRLEDLAESYIESESRGR